MSNYVEPNAIECNRVVKVIGSNLISLIKLKAIELEFDKLNFDKFEFDELNMRI